MSRNVTLVIVVILVLIVGGWFLTRPKRVILPKSTEIPASPVLTESAATSVSITSSGFSPSDLTILKGETVSWTNSDTNTHTVDSGPHPVHTLYPPLNLGTIKPGEKKSLTFPKSGIYQYHDHLNSSLTGSVTVQ